MSPLAVSLGQMSTQKCKIGVNAAAYMMALLWFVCACEILLPQSGLIQLGVTCV